MKRRVMIAILGIMTAISLAGCGQKSPDTETIVSSMTKEETEAETEKEKETEVESTGEDEPEKTYNTADMPEVTLVYSEVNPIDSISGQIAVDFKEKAEELSDGKIKIDIHAGGELGSENDVLDSMLGGGETIDMSRISAFALSNYGGEKSKLLSLPYVFVNRDHFWNFATSSLAREFLNESQENGFGVRGLFYGEEGFRNFFTTEEIHGVEDLSGMKIRVSNDPVMSGLVEGLGAYPTVVSFGELYSALEFKVVDGAEQPIGNYQSNKFTEVAPNLILDGHTLGAVQVVITDLAWNKLTEEQQEILMEAGTYASKQNRKNSERMEREVLEELKAEGVNVTEVEDKTPWQEAAKAVIDENIKGYEELYQKILDMQ